MTVYVAIMESKYFITDSTWCSININTYVHAYIQKTYRFNVCTPTPIYQYIQTHQDYHRQLSIPAPEVKSQISLIIYRNMKWFAIASIIKCDHQICTYVYIQFAWSHFHGYRFTACLPSWFTWQHTKVSASDEVKLYPPYNRKVASSSQNIPVWAYLYVYI